MWLCARCVGVLAGAGLTLLGLAAAAAVGSRLGVASLAGWGAIGTGLCLLDWSVQATGLRPSTNARRLATGLAGGAGTVAAVVSAVVWLGGLMG